MTSEIETGRSMVEMLGTLAIMGVLSVISVVGFQSLMDSYHANAIINDAKIIYLDASSTQSLSDMVWHDVTYHVDSGRAFQIMRDKNRNNYVKVKSVEQGVCEKILDMSVENVLSFFMEDYTEMTTCAEDNNIIVVWNGLAAQGACDTVSDCGSNFAGICNQDGLCQQCDPFTEHANADGTACECNPGTAQCQDGDTTWCCANGLSCDILNKTCVNGGGACKYTYTEQVQTKSANCRYLISAQTQTKAANCHYRITGTDNGNNLHSITMTLVGDGCAPDEYCYISHFDENCTTTINRGNVGANGPEDVYGTCLQRTVTSNACNITNVSTNFMQELDGCAPDEYCYISHFDENCTSSINRGDIGANQAEEVWGTCLKRTSNGGTCNITAISGGLSEVQGCPAGQYCYLKWQGSDCSTVINGGNVTGEMFGACIDRTSNTVNQCPIQN